MFRRAISVALLITPAALFGGLHGCGDTSSRSQNICNWLSDSNSCLTRFANDVGTQCGKTFQAGSDPVADASGFFADRADLSICVINAGGQIIFDPPLDVATFPVTSVAYTVLDKKAAECGKGSASGGRTYSITINAVDVNDAGATTAADGGPLSDSIVGGTYSSAVSDGGAVSFDVSCPGGQETHHFNASVVALKCPEFTSLLPQAIIDSSPGIAETSTTSGQSGFVRLRLAYPPENPTAGADPRVIEYFNCLIPAPPPPCEDGTKNGDETDTDCGGSCSSKCADGQGCSVDADCQSGDCGLNGGLQQCLPAT